MMHNAAFRRFARNVFSAFSANAVRLLVSVALLLALPRVLDVETYGYWQLYLFYLAFLMYASLGWTEGLYLKYGGKAYAGIDARGLSGQFWGQAIFEAGLCLALLGAFAGLAQGVERLVLCLAVVTAYLDILRYTPQTVLMVTDRMRDYARVVAAERLLFLAFAVGAIAMGLRSLVPLIVADILGRLFSLLYAVWLCRDKLWGAALPAPRAVAREGWGMVRLGFALYAATLVSQLIVGIVRFFIERKWGAVVFGKVSLTLSVANIGVSCVGAIGIALFPALRKLGPGRLKSYYGFIRSLLLAPVLVILLFYEPLDLLLEAWLPRYAEGLRYLAILFPLCLYEARTLILTDTYFKACSRTDRILLINCLCVAAALACAVATVVMAGNLTAAVLSIVALSALRCALSEAFIRPLNGGRPFFADALWEAALMVVFICSNWFAGGWAGTAVYACALAVYLCFNGKGLLRDFERLRAFAARGAEGEGALPDGGEGGGA